MFVFDRVTKVMLALLVLGVWCLLIKSVVPLPAVEAQGKTAGSQGDVAEVIKTRGLIVVDENGRERVVIGTPVPDLKEGKRSRPMTGIVINDPNGYERFGMGLTPDGDMQLGLDAPPGKGDDRNRERLHLIADSEGGATLRFLNRKTSVPGWLRLGDDDKLYLEFIDVQPEKNKVYTRKIGMNGEEKTEEPFK